ncbi:MAG: hypothetical protein V2A34_14925, partial [Lentisphaerota bacterium]
TNDPVHVLALALPNYDAQNIAITSYYRIGTSGAFTTAGMIVTGRVYYTTTSAIPPQVTGTRVQYYVASTFTGPGNELTSPSYYPEGGPTNPASYVIPRYPAGKVWINEINYINDPFGDDTNEFVELCGLGGINISGWTIRLYIAAETNRATYYATYAIAEGTVISNETDGYGFYVLGDRTILNAPVDQVFTHTNNYWWDGFNPLSQISDGFYSSGVELLNEAGSVEQRLVYLGQLDGFTSTHAQEEEWAYPDPFSLQLSGHGSNYNNFIWRTNYLTPGAINADQVLDPPPEPPEGLNAEIIWSVIGTNIIITTYGNTNATPWAVQPYVATNLPRLNQDWTAVSPFNSTFAGGTNIIWFQRPTGVNNFYRIMLTK